MNDFPGFMLALMLVIFILAAQGCGHYHFEWKYDGASHSLDLGKAE